MDGTDFGPEGKAGSDQHARGAAAGGDSPGPGPLLDGARGVAFAGHGPESWRVPSSRPGPGSSQGRRGAEKTPCETGK